MLNKKVMTALSLTLTSVCFSGTMGPICAPGSLTVPCATSAWDIGVQALYLKPAFHGLENYDAVPLVTTGISPTDTLYTPQELNGDKWRMGYAIEGAYHFSTGNDIRMQWTHFDTNHDDHHFDNFMHKTRFNQANLEFGQHVDFDVIKNVRFNGGLQYADLHISSVRTQTFATTNDFAPSTAIVLRHQNYADYSGFGPMMGVDFAYLIGTTGFSFTANTTTSLLYGTGRANTNTSANSLVTDQQYVTRKMMVPGLEEKLGINYDTQFAQGRLSINGGYQALNYFNIINRAQSPRVAISDFGLYGPYFGVRWLGVA